ncbi:MAG: PEP/pyruvate-binding domain-containing protein [Candidatus Hodarchaeota archaeon]
MSSQNFFTVNLKDISEISIKDIGVKGANLSLLIQNDFCVPEGYILKANAYSLFISVNNLNQFIEETLKKIDYNEVESIEKCSKLIRAKIEENFLPNNVINEIKAQYINFNVAIRSSATAEDLPHASFAGQYDSFLNINGIENILTFIKRCYASLWNSRAIIYRKKNLIHHENVKIAIIIQRMVPVKSAGVLFTLNPMSANKSELLIESTFGLGESIVSGRVNPDQFTIIRMGKKSKESFKILNKRIGNKKYVILPKPLENELGVDSIELNEEERKNPSLSDKEIHNLARVGIQIEKLFNGIPQDIEWAVDDQGQIYVLQTRPITAAKVASISDLPVFSRGYSDDYWNDNTTPLFFDLLGDHLTKVVNIELNSIMGYKKMDVELLKLYNAHVYFNLKVLKKKVEYEIPKFIRNEDVLYYFPEGSGPFGKETMRSLPFRLFRRLFSELRIMFHDPDGSMSKTDEAYNNWTERTFIPYCNDFDSKLNTLVDSEDPIPLYELAEELDKVMITHFRLVRYGIPVHNIGMNLMTQYLLNRFLSRKETRRYYPILISGLKHKLTETNDQIHNLASIIQKSSYLKKIFMENQSKDVLNILSSQEITEVKEFFKKFTDFLKEYGDRGFTREPYYPRWNESPELIFDILKSLITEKWQKFEREKVKSLNRANLISKYIETKIRSQKFGLIKWKLFSVILKNSRKYIIFRENQRFNLDKWITRNRKIFLEIGKKFMKKGILDNENKIFFLQKKEIKRIIYNNFDVNFISSLVEKRYSDFLQNENLIPPKFILGFREFDDKMQFNQDSTIFYGVPASQGITTARIRVLKEISLIPLIQTGEILVVPRTDPGWTPIFSKIGGLITETGGILSHGAVVSREYGVPAVTNIPNACKLFKDGQIVTINGYNGAVIIKK